MFFGREINIFSSLSSCRLLFLFLGINHQVHRIHDSMSKEVLILRIGPINEVLTSVRNPGCSSIK